MKPAMKEGKRKLGDDLKGTGAGEDDGNVDFDLSPDDERG